MVLNPATLGTLIKNNIEAARGITITDTDGIATINAIASAIITHLTTDGVVNTIVTTPDTINGTGSGTIL